MGALRVALFTIFVIDCILLVIAVLLQSGRGGGLAGALGGIGGADSALGVRAASQIEKATAIMAVIFLVVALALAFTAGEPVDIPKDTKTGDRATIGATGSTRPAGTLTTSRPGETSGPADTSRPKATSPGTAPAAARP